MDIIDIGAAVVKSKEYTDEIAASIVAGDIKSIAREYDATSTYAVGNYCLVNAKLYRCNTAITVPEAWNVLHWTETTSADEICTLSQNKADKTYTVGFINIGMFSTLSEFQTVLLGISFNDGKPQAICTNFNASFDPYCGGNWEGHLYKASPDYFCGEITQYGSSSAVKVLFSYSNGTWSHNRVAFYTEDLLWANPDTTVEFPAQTINLSSSVTNYRLIKIHYQYMAAIGYQLETETLANVGAYALVSASTANNLYRTAYLASTQIAFSDCKIQTAIGQDAVYNTGLIPYRVYGVKW